MIERLAQQIEEIKKKLGFSPDQYPKVNRDKNGRIRSIIIHESIYEH